MRTTSFRGPGYDPRRDMLLGAQSRVGMVPGGRLRSQGRYGPRGYGGKALPRGQTDACENIAFP